MRAARLPTWFLSRHMPPGFLQAISARVHMMQTLSQEPLPDWYVNGRGGAERAADQACLDSLKAGTGGMYGCIAETLAADKRAYMVSAPAWMDTWPREQLHIMQASLGRGMCRPGMSTGTAPTPAPCSSPALCPAVPPTPAV